MGKATSAFRVDTIHVLFASISWFLPFTSSWQFAEINHEGLKKTGNFRIIEIKSTQRHRYMHVA